MDAKKIRYRRIRDARQQHPKLMFLLLSTRNRTKQGLIAARKNAKRRYEEWMDIAMQLFEQARSKIEN